ncbi:MAG: hypothetical protein FJ276_21710 [Planctomycetes bacterium]|nr:hypothetical protein [Planctomycetota bacterium]
MRTTIRIRPCLTIILLVAASKSLLRASEAEDPLPKDLPSLVKHLSAKDPRWRGLAAAELGNIGETANSAVPALVGLLADEGVVAFGIPGGTVREAASEALSRIGRPAVADLVTALGSGDARVRGGAAAALGGMVGGPPKESLPALLPLLRDCSVDVRLKTLDAIGKMRSEANPALGSVLEVLGDDPEPIVRQYAARAAASLETEGTRVIPALIRRLHDQDPDVRGEVARALGSYGRAATLAIVPLAESLSDNQSRWQAETADSNRPRAVRYDMATALGEIGPAAASALPRLRDLSREDSDGEVRVAAALAVLRINAGDNEALSVIIKVIVEDSQDLWGKLVALEAVETLGPRAVRATSALEEALGHWHVEVRMGAATALATVAGKAAVPLLIQRLCEEKREGDRRRDSGDDYADNKFVRWQIAEGLARIGPDADAAVTVLANAVGDTGEDVLVRRSAAIALGRIGAASHEAVPQLISAVSDDQANLRHAAVVALGEIGPLARTAVPLLLRLAESDPDKEIRAGANAAIQRIVREDAKTVPETNGTVHPGKGR